MTSPVASCRVGRSRLQRRIVLSQVYAQSTRPASATATLAATRDPDNQLLWSQPMRRLELEAMPGLVVRRSNSLDYRMGGRPTDATAVDGAQRRTVYGLVDRQNLPGLFRVFDFASPDVSVGRRPRTLVAQQALFALNSPLMVARANDLAVMSSVRSRTMTVGSSCLYGESGSEPKR
ncbi:MAG: DUF1553 domain-containing protein [Pirellulaceae bacterium]